MPFVLIDLPEGKSLEDERAIADAIHDAMVATIGIPAADRFQIISRRPPAARIFDRGYLGVARSDDWMLVQITLKSGRTPDQKRALYRQVAANLQTRTGTNPGDVMISLTENEPIDWSFGNGEAQIAPPSSPLGRTAVKT
jgi:phenylpyruvate tautomerase PptA (4-oxalocrotonate tautomerase family)